MEILSSALFQKSINTLTGFQKQGVKFKIILPTGQEFGELEVVKEKTRTRVVSKNRPYGSLRSYIAPFLEGMKAGDVCVIPLATDIPDFDSKKLMSNVSAYCCGNWGNGCAIVAPTPNGGVEVMRIEPEIQIPLIKKIDTVE